MVAADMIYAMTGVEKPQTKTEDLDNLSAKFSTVATTAATVGAGVTGVNANIAAANQGAALDKFQASIGESIQHLTYLGERAAKATAAHKAAAAAVTSTEKLMDGVCLQAAGELAKLLITPMWPWERARRWQAVLDAARQKLVTLDTVGASVVTGAYNGTLPIDKIKVSEGEARGTVPPEIVTEYANLTPEQRRQLLTNLANQVMKDWPPDKKAKIVFYSHAEPLPPGCVRPPNGEDWSGNNGVSMGDTIYLNYDIGCERPDGKPAQPTLMSTTVHELQHQRQNHMRQEYNALSQSDREAIRNGQKADPFAKYGSTIHEVGDRFGTPYEGGGKPRYEHQYVEVDARRAGTEYLDNMTVEEMRKLVPR